MCRRSGAGTRSPSGTVRLARGFLAGDNLTTITLPVLQQLTALSGETCGLYIRQGGDRILVQRVESPHPLRHHTPIGERLPLHIGASGHILCAGMPDDLLHRYLEAARSDPPRLRQAARKEGAFDAYPAGPAARLCRGNRRAICGDRLCGGTDSPRRQRGDRRHQHRRAVRVAFRPRSWSNLPWKYAGPPMKSRRHSSTCSAPASPFGPDDPSSPLVIRFGPGGPDRNPGRPYPGAGHRTTHRVVCPASGSLLTARRRTGTILILGQCPI